MKRRTFNNLLSSSSLVTMTPFLHSLDSHFKVVKVGVIGLDTSHSIAFSKIINNPPEGKSFDFKVTHAYPYGSRQIESSFSRIEGYIANIKELGVEITDSIQQLLDQVDVVLLETNDGRLHLEQALEVFSAGKPVFIDKPISAHLPNAIRIFAAAEEHQVPMFSSSSLRFGPSTQEVVNGKIGRVLGADTFSPAKLEKTHTDLYWYGIHGVESLCTVMNTGCRQVRRVFTEAMEVVTGEWEGGRIGTFRGLRSKNVGYGGHAFGTEGIAPVGAYEGYEHLVYEILTFFQTGVAPVSKEQTLEIFAFMTAADESRKRNGAVVTLAEVVEAAQG
ncbi:MAG: Gfo/Idh/MocA family oxidoreductase [Saprospiraceae bacterium]|nr:Gfo/Idh/MocA family oxidoreductase [Saprospiraceae bacterium]